MAGSDLYAHTPNDNGDWHLLDDHLNSVAELAGDFAAKFAMDEFGRVAGLLHDIGKASPEFQSYLSAAYVAKQQGKPPPRSRVDHKSAGAVIAADIGQLLPFPILGHHGGLMDMPAVKQKLSEGASRGTAGYRPRGLSADPLPVPALTKALECETLVRMLFSTLVDADFRDTERHWEPDKSELRENNASLADLWEALVRDQERLKEASEPTSVNLIREEIYDACVSAASKPQGVFRLTVPTGGGKTRSGMAFALKHAVEHNLDRVIVAIPYTSIIDQNAKVYREIFGSENVLEHHSAVDLGDSDEYSEEAQRMLLAAENWDAPIVVTTTVQLFESLFSNKPSRCRKLHNIARSVIILDEVQTLPVGLLTPIIDMLKELVAHYGVTLVLSTATQPAFSGESPYLKGFSPEPEEIVPELGRYFQELKRVDYNVVSEPWSWDRVAAEMREEPQVLCVVNSRKDALQLFEQLKDCDPLHLSTLMCPAHRRDVLEEIRSRLSDGEPCRVVSTQVVEAGVDLDFPVVLRAMGPLDRIVQAAGRCNREGKLDSGRVTVFTPESGSFPRGIYQLQMELAPGVLRQNGADMSDPTTIERYFGDLYRIAGRSALDTKGISRMRKDGLFEQVARAARLIEDDTVAVVVQYCREETGKLLEDIEHKGFASRRDWRRLQQYSISIYRWDHQRNSRDIKEVIPGLSVWVGDYGDAGIIVERDPCDLIV
jgi:CRISPR-associated endonuclease/helicase Cas3